ncbi:unnamed protein product, partial [Strongylus vulgaris]
MTAAHHVIRIEGSGCHSHLAAPIPTLPPDFAEPSFPRPGDLGGPLVIFNETD